MSHGKRQQGRGTGLNVAIIYETNTTQCNAARKKEGGRRNEKPPSFFLKEFTNLSICRRSTKEITFIIPHTIPL